MTLGTTAIDNGPLADIESASITKASKAYQVVTLDVGGTGVEKIFTQIAVASPGTHQVHVATTVVTTALAANASREFVTIQNLSDVDVWIGLDSDPAVDGGLVISPKDVLEIDRTYTGDIRCIRAAAAGTKNLFVVEL